VASREFNREGKRRLLVEVAAQAFAEQGFAGTRVADIADRAGVAKGTVYEYFSSKEELFFAVFESINRRIWERVDRVRAAHESARDQLVALFRFGGELVVEQSDLYPIRNLDLWVTPRGSDFEEAFTDVVDSQYRDYRQLAADIIRRGQQSGEFRGDIDPDGVATLLVGALDGLGKQYWLDKSIDPGKSSEQFVLALCRGLLCPENE
jgi:AcrR family transcriptional regulator